MAIEIERKFLLAPNVGLKSITDGAISSFRISQGYLNSAPGRTVRVRVKGNKGFLTVKGRNDDKGLVRYEWETEIPVERARELLQLCEKHVIDKTRYNIEYGGHIFELDVFHGDNEGLVFAELELNAADEPYEKPEWLGEEVTGDRRYYNSYIAGHPYCKW